MAGIRGKEHLLRDIFSAQFSFTIPSFQRPYSWGTENAKALINDLIAFMQEAKPVKELPPYFLGSIVLIKREGAPEAEVVDGQQRLTTVTMLLAVIRTLVSSEHKQSLTKFIYEEGNGISDTPDRYRLTLRESDTEFFQRYIQHEGGIEKIKALDPDHLSDSRRKIRSNALLLLEHVEALSEDQRIRLAQAIIRRCYLVEISTSDLESAYNVFSILNDRGLNLSHNDILKAQIIGKISSNRRKDYTMKWEYAEELLGIDHFRQLFRYMNFIYQPEALRNEPLLTSFRKNVYPSKEPNRDPEKFIDEVLIPYTEALDYVENACYRGKGSKEINKLLRWLYVPNRPEPREGPIIYWIPIALQFFVLYANTSGELIRFFKDLERLEVVLKTLYYLDMQSRRSRYFEIIRYIHSEKDLYAPDSPLQLKPSEKEAFLEMINGKFYGQRMALYILTRIDDAIAAADEAVYTYPITTIEHVLPQNPRENSIWNTWFPTEPNRKKYINLLGNLVLLSRPKNSEAQNYDFAEKKRKYFLSEKGISSFALTTQVLQEEEWTPEVIERRQKMLIDKIKKIW